MYSLFRKIEKITNSAIALSYIFMTLVIAFHIHAVDLEVNPSAKVSGGTTNQHQIALTGYEKCTFIHQASSTVQFFESNSPHINALTFVATLSSFQFNSYSFCKVSLSHLRAPPIFS